MKRAEREVIILGFLLALYIFYLQITHIVFEVIGRIRDNQIHDGQQGIRVVNAVVSPEIFHSSVVPAIIIHTYIGACVET